MSEASGGRGPKVQLNMNRRSFLQTAAGGAALAASSGLLDWGGVKKAEAFPYEPYPRDDELETVVTSCAHNCGSRHVLVAHKKGDVIVRLSTDDGRFQQDGSFGKDTFEEPQLRACLRGRSYRSRLYSPERLLHPMIRSGERGSGQFRRVSWDTALDYVAEKMVSIKARWGNTALLDQSYAGASYGVLHKSDQIEGLLGRFLGMFGCRTSSWSIPSYEATKFSSRMTFGTIEDGNEDDTFAHSKLIIMWGWNPAYTFHGGNTFYYMRLAKQQGCKFVVIDPQYTDSAATYDAWWIPIRPNTDAAMMAGMAYHIFERNLQDQQFINRFCQGIDAGTMPEWAKGQENFRDYLFGKYDNTPKTPEWAEAICQVPAKDIRKLAEMYATTKPAALKASWAPGRNAYGEQYNRMAAALQAMTGNIGVLGGCSEGIGKAWHAEAVAYPYDQYANIYFASIKSDTWAHCVLNYPNVQREDIGLWPRADATDGVIPNIKGIFWQGSDWLNQLPNINKQLQAIKKLELVVCLDSTITPSGLWADVLLPVATHFERHDVALPWYKGHYYIHRPKVIEPMGESKSDFQIFTELAWRISPVLGQAYNPRAARDYFHHPDDVDEAYLSAWWQEKVMGHQNVRMDWQTFKRTGIYKFKLDKPHVAFREQIEKGVPFQTPSGKIEIFSTQLATIQDWKKSQFGTAIPAIPKWIEPWESLNSPKTATHPYHLISPHPRWRTHSIFHNIPWLRETYDQEVTINARDAEKLGIQTGDTVELYNDRGGVVVPAYVTERCMPGVLVLHEGAWMDLDKEGWDRAGNPDFLTLDAPSPAGGFAYNTVLVKMRKSKERSHRPGWDQLAISRAHIFRRDQ
ncbi:molybdopterin-containing oxidoreductase family protein [Candidatus Magnetaquicoccus inordinatus]|uniref:molybdopterin-containing oxidoreductase family protein n=1 Tax=Candidatus Magnetaquicoccus inordinatus TaxID=2496818 RepID=UPI00102C5353|nr:molybdopterin-dependent oxidoreductase [Candidatus Magnetaquicoccus inordinatus]